MTAAKKRGYEGQVYRNTGTHASATWNAIGAAMDVKVGDSFSTFDASDRNSATKKALAAQQELSLEFSFIWDASDTDLTALRTAYRARTAIDLWATDGDSATTGVSGPNAEWLITEWSCDMPLADGMKVTVKCVPHGNCSFEPEYKTVT
jgi:hypothetical protein